MQIIGNKELPAQPKFGLIDFTEVTQDSLKGDRREQAEVGPHQDISVVPSGQTHVKLNGSKCQHGVYIPKYHPDSEENRAGYCSLCNPYIIEVPGGDSEPSNS